MIKSKTIPAKDVCTEPDLKELLRRAMATMPGLKGLDIPIDRIPSDAEFNALNEKFDADMNAFMLDPANDIEAVIARDIPIHSRVHKKRGNVMSCKTHGTRHTTIRLPEVVVQKFLTKAEQAGIGYQTLMVRVLKEASKDWAV